VLGASGLLGAAIYRHLVSTGEFAIYGTARSDSSLIRMQANKSELSFIIDKTNPDYIINCIASLRKSKTLRGNIELFKINSIFPRQLARISQERGTFIIHFSTNAVFHGHSGSYHESSLRVPSSLYGLSKLLGEPRAQNVLVLRTSFIGLGSRDNSIASRIRNAPKNSLITGFENQYWNGVSTGILAKLCAGLIRGSRRSGGISHFHASSTISRYELIRMIAKRISREDLRIQRSSSRRLLDLTLRNSSPKLHKELWQFAGFPNPLTVSEIIEHYL
jgi:dTDP-4-dehydrorhamnose reductase